MAVNSPSQFPPHEGHDPRKSSSDLFPTQSEREVAYSFSQFGHPRIFLRESYGVVCVMCEGGWVIAEFSCKGWVARDWSRSDEMPVRAWKKEPAASDKTKVHVEASIAPC